MSKSSTTQYPIVKNEQHKINKTAVFTGLLLFVIVILALSQVEEQKQPQEVASLSEIYNPVRFIKVKKNNHTSLIRSTGEVISQNTIDIKVQIGGEITYVNIDFFPGNHIKKGTVICKIQNSQYKYQLAEAKNRFSQAQLALLIEQQKKIQARQDWKRTGHKLKPESSLVLRQPQYIAAQAELDAAQSAIEHAENELEFTIIRSPFDGVIVARSLNNGEIIETGSVLGRIIDTKTLDITISLTESNWKLMPDDWKNTNVELYSISHSSGCCLPTASTVTNPRTKSTSKVITANQYWKAKIRNIAQFLDQQTRLRTVYLETTNDLLQGNTKPLLPGSFVEVIIPGRKMENILKIPESAYTRNSKIWVIDDNNRLQSLYAEIRFTKNNFIFVQLKNMKNGVYRIVLYPQSSFTIGQRITPVEIPLSTPKLLTTGI